MGSKWGVDLCYREFDRALSSGRTSLVVFLWRLCDASCLCLSCPDVGVWLVMSPLSCGVSVMPDVGVRLMVLLITCRTVKSSGVHRKYQNL